MIRAHNRKAGNLRVQPTRHRPRRRLLPCLVIPAVQLLILLASTSACSAPTIAGGGTPTPGIPAARAASGTPVQPASAAPGVSPGAQPTVDPATLNAKVRLEAAVTGAAAGGTQQPDTAQIRAAVVAAGFASDEVEITEGRTPTGLAADAVEIAVRLGRNCIIAQLRGGSVAAGVLPALAGGGCLIGTVGTR